MWWNRRRLSDAEFVERLRNNPRVCRQAGAIRLGTALILWGFAGYFLPKFTTGAWRFEESPAEQMAFQFGGLVGGGGTTAMFSAMLWLVWRCGTNSPDRREEMLLEYHQRLTEPGQLPIKTSGSAV